MDSSTGPGCPRRPRVHLRRRGGRVASPSVPHAPGRTRCWALPGTGEVGEAGDQPDDGAVTYDAVVVGARCAGATTALLLARAGHRVLLLDRAKFPSDTLSTLYIHQPGV